MKLYCFWQCTLSTMLCRRNIMDELSSVRRRRQLYVADHVSQLCSCEFMSFLPCKGKADDLYRGSMQFVNHRRTALQYPLVHWTICRCHSMALLAWRPSQGTKLYCLVNRGILGVNNLPRVVARIMPRSESNPRPRDHESNALPLRYRVTKIMLCRVWLCYGESLRPPICQVEIGIFMEKLDFGKK